MADSDNGAWISEFNSLAVTNCVGWATFTLVVYDYLITIGTEVELFWSQDITGASVLFFLNRYIILCDYLSLLRAQWPFTQSTCGQWANGTRAIECLFYVPWGAFSALRVFALSGRNWFLGITVFLLYLVPVGINFADFHWSTTVIDPVWGCVQTESESAVLSTRFTIFSRSSLIAADMIVIVVTWSATYKAAMMASTVFHGKRMTFSFLMWRDGLIYFIVMLAMNVLHLAFSTSSVLVDSGNGDTSNIIQFVEPMNAILTWRLMLNLQETRKRTVESSTFIGTRNASSVYFDRVVGSIGESRGGQSILEEDT